MVDTPQKMDAGGTRIVRTLRDAGFEAYYAGGCVRNRLLGRSVPDIDIATSARPDDIEKLFPKTVPVGRAFGVMIVMVDGIQYEVATFRSDGAYLDGRHPSSVSFSDVRSDVERRDFTVNGMMYDPIEDRILDYVHGREDLEKKIIRTIGDAKARFSEDKLRLMRAVRFAAALQFEIAPDTWSALKEMAGAIEQVSAERISAELRKILVDPHRSEGLELLYQSGLLRVILPEVADMDGVPQPANFHPEGDVWIHTKLALDALENPSFEVALATLLHDVGKPVTITHEDRIRFTRHEKVGASMARRIGKRLKLSNDEIDRISWLVGQHMVFHQIDQMRGAKVRRLIGHDYFPDLEKVHRADAMASSKNLYGLEFVDRVRRETPDVKPDPWVTGNDLIEMGFPPGPEFGSVLRDTYDAQLENRVEDREKALEFARRHPALSDRK